MAIIKVRGQEIDVDIEAELREYEWGGRERWSASKLIASSPFREDRSPSFYVNLDGKYAGYWGDSGAIDLEYSKGNFVALIAYLRGENEREAEDYLLGEYGNAPGETERIRLKAPKLRMKRIDRKISEESVTKAISPYLKSRGISDDVQRKFGVGYGDDIEGFTAIPWHTPDGRLANIKYRSTSGKRFFFEKNATPVKDLVYGIDLVDGDFAVICEGEIDAMSWWTAGIPAIALGGGNITPEQADIIRRSRIERLALGGDNDEIGAILNEKIKKELMWDLRMYTVDYGEHKDANDVLMRQGVEVLYEIASKASPIQALHLRV